MKKFLSTFLAVFLLALPLVAKAGTVTVKGSDTMVILGQRWAEEFMKKNPDTKLQVTGGGSGTGIAALINGTTDICHGQPPHEGGRDREAAQPLQHHRRRRSPWPRTASPSTSTRRTRSTSLTLEQLKGIYLGDITNWKDVGGPDAPIVLYSRENSSGTYVFVKDNLLEGEDYTASAQTLPGTAAVVNAVAKEKNGIGYGGAAYAKGVKELKMKVGSDELAPTAENIKSGKYPLSRDLYFYLRGKPSGEAKAFIDFALSPEGQQIVNKVGYFPVK